MLTVNKESPLVMSEKEDTVILGTLTLIRCQNIMCIICSNKLSYILGMMYLMKYNIMVVFNSSYFPFGKVWINSLYDKNNMSNVDKVFIVDTGLKEEEKEYFKSKGSEVYIYDTGLDTDFNDGGAWGKGWQENVGSKTIIFQHLLSMTDIPLMMVDGDCIFVKDFFLLCKFFLLAGCIGSQPIGVVIIETMYAFYALKL